MVYKNFYINIIFRVIFLIVAISISTWYFFVNVHYLRAGYALILVVILGIEMVWYINRINRDLSTFLLSILEEDFSTHFSKVRKGSSYNRLYRSFNDINEKFRRLSIEKETQFIFLEILVDQLSVGVISFDAREDIQLINRAARNYLEKPRLGNLSFLKNEFPELYETFQSIKPRQNKLVRMKSNGQLLYFSIHASEFKVSDSYYKLVTFHNIKNELDANELDAWQKLIRVLTHEIMNSVTPITSLSETLHEKIERRRSKAKVDKNTLTSLSEGLAAIRSRSKGLQTFTKAYQNLTKLPVPKFEEVNLKKLIRRVESLLKTDLEKSEINLKIHVNPEVVAKLDPGMFEQVLINILKNSIDVLEDHEKAEIKVNITKDDGHVTLDISDNGPGIAPDDLDKIFIPFFTTKEKGSGIGLAVSRQIVRMHGGTLNVYSEQGKGASFIIHL